MVLVVLLDGRGELVSRSLSVVGVADIAVLVGGFLLAAIVAFIFLVFYWYCWDADKQHLKRSHHREAQIHGHFERDCSFVACCLCPLVTFCLRRVEKWVLCL